MSLSFLPSISLQRCGLALLSTAAAWAQDSIPSPLTLAQALARAGERNPTLLAESFQERAAHALIEQAGVRPNPTLELEAENFLGTGARQGVRGLEATVQASQTIERGDKREKRIAVATRERESAARELAVLRAEILGKTAIAFVETLAAQRRVALAAEPVRLAREIAGSADSRIQQGAASPAEAARARAALAIAQGELRRAQGDLDAARIRLAAAWGGDAAEVMTVAGSVQLPDTLPPADSFLAKLAGHPRLAHQQANIAGRRAALQLEQAQAAQDVRVGGGVRFFRDGSDAGFVAGVSVPLPVRHQNQGNIRAAREVLAGAEQKVPAIEAELRAAFTAAWQELAAAHATAQTLRREVLPATEEAHAVVRRAYEQGQLALLDVLEAQRELIQLRRELLATETTFIAAHVRAESFADPAFPATARLLSSP